jgi:hypothetical protein
MKSHQLPLFFIDHNKRLQLGAGNHIGSKNKICKRKNKLLVLEGAKPNITEKKKRQWACDRCWTALRHFSSTGGDQICGHRIAFSPMAPEGDGNCPLATFFLYRHVSAEMSFRLFPGLDPAQPVQTASNRPPCELKDFVSWLPILCTLTGFTSSHYINGACVLCGASSHLSSNQMCPPFHEPNNWKGLKRNTNMSLELRGLRILERATNWLHCSDFEVSLNMNIQIHRSCILSHQVFRHDKKKIRVWLACRLS